MLDDQNPRRKKPMLGALVHLEPRHSSAGCGNTTTYLPDDVEGFLRAIPSTIWRLKGGSKPMTACLRYKKWAPDTRFALEAICKTGQSLIAIGLAATFESERLDQLAAQHLTTRAKDTRIEGPITTPLPPIAMWSPPRARSDDARLRILGCRVMDEPFYAYWLAATQKTDDPGYAATLAAHETDWRVVANDVIHPDLSSCHRSCQKHMAIHADPVDLSFMRHLRNCFLIRHPAEVIASMAGFRTWFRA